MRKKARNQREKSMHIKEYRGAPITEALVTQNKLIENNKWNTELLAYAVTFIPSISE